MSDTDQGRDADWFWGIIERAHQDQDQLRAILSELPKDDVYRFQDWFVEMSVELQDEPYLDHVGPDVSEDGMEDIADWVVAQGRVTYERILTHPEQIPPTVDGGDPALLRHVAYEVYYERFGEPLDVM